MSEISSDVSADLLLPPDSPGSSVSTTLQEEYDELLKYAVVVPAGSRTLPAPGQSFPLFRQLVDAHDFMPTQQQQEGQQLATHGFDGDDEREQTLEEGTVSESDVLDDDGNRNDFQQTELGSGVHINIDQRQLVSSSTPRDTPTPTQENPASDKEVGYLRQEVFTEDTRKKTEQFQRHHHVQQSQSSQSVRHPVRHFEPTVRPVSQDDSIASSRYTEGESQLVYTSGVDPDVTRMENLLDHWALDLKRNVLAEYGQCKIKNLELHKQEMMRLKERNNTEKNQLYNEIESLKELLHTYEKSIERKDQIISNLTNGIQKQKEKFEKQRTFCEWKMNHTECRKEAFAMNLARRHHERSLVRRAWCAWHGVIENNWRARVEKACQAKAQEVCLQLTNDYETQIAELNGALAATREEVAGLNGEKERYEENMKKAFMRGVCALNMEAMNMFSDDDRAGSSAVTSARDSERDLHYQQQHTHQSTTGGYHKATASQAGITTMGSTRDPYAEQTQGAPGSVSQHRVIVGSQPPAPRMANGQPVPTQSKIMTAGPARKSKSSIGKVSAKVDTGRVKSSSTSVLAPPMSSVVVERHPPVNKQTIGQATASQFPSKSKQLPVGRQTSGNSVHVTAPHLQTIKVVD